MLIVVTIGGGDRGG